MSSTSELLKALGIGAGTIGAGAAIHGAGLGRVLEPLDWPRQALANLVRSPMKAMETGDVSELLGALPGLAGATLGGVVGGPVGLLAGSLLGGGLQGIGNLSGREQFKAPSVQDITGTEDFLPNLAVGMATDPLTYAGLGSSWSAGAKALRGAAPAVEAAAKAIPEAIPVAKIAPQIPVAKKVVPAFYSRLEEGIAKLPDSIKSESVINQLKKMGVTNEEIEATNLAKALEGKPRVSKQDLMNHFGENKVQVEEVMKRSSDPNKVFEDPVDELFRQDTLPREETAKFNQYQTPGGSNYRELLLTTPQTSSLPEGFTLKKVDNPHGPGGKSFQIVKSDGSPVPGQLGERTFPTEKQAIDVVGARSEAFQGSHWEEPNVLAHVRFNDRVGPNGEKILHIEEIQSDWHQQGRKEGYGITQPRTENGRSYEELFARHEELMNSPNPDQAELRRITNELDRLHEANMQAGVGVDEPFGVPHGPFKDTWHELSMKRMIRYAAEHNYDEITLNSGEQINKVLGGGDSLAGQKKFYDEQLPNWMKKYAKQHGVKVEIGSSKSNIDQILQAKKKYLELLEQKNAAIDVREFDKYYALREELDKAHRELQSIEEAKSLPTRMPLNASMREQALTRGLPLMQMGAGAGGSALLAALLSQENS